MANERLYRENVTFLIAAPEAFADKDNPTAAELNDTASGLVANITCALWEDDTEFTLGDSDTDDGLTFCSKAGEETPTFYNPTVVYTALRDKERTANGVFNLAFDWLAFPDCEQIAILRVGKDSDVPFAAGDRIKMVAVKTDNGVDVVGSGENVRLQQSFLNNDWINWNHEVTA